MHTGLRIVTQAACVAGMTMLAIWVSTPRFEAPPATHDTRAATAAQPETYTVEVIGGDDCLVAGALVCILWAEPLPIGFTPVTRVVTHTNGRGSVELAGRSPARLIVVAPSHAPSVHACRQRSGVERVVLSSEILLAGRVQVDQAPPPEPILLKLRCEPTLGPDCPADIRVFVQDWLDHHGGIRTQTSPTGAFAYYGACRPQSGTLIGPLGYHAPGRRGGRLEQVVSLPSNDGLWILEPTIRVAGNADDLSTWSDEAACGAEPTVAGDYSSRSLQLSGPISIECTLYVPGLEPRRQRIFVRIGKQFSFTLDPHAATHGELSVYRGHVDIGGPLLARVPINPPFAGQLIDLDAHLRKISLQVQDATGRPIRGAHVTPGAGGLNRTMRDGQVTVHMTPGTETLTVGALGYRTTSASVADGGVEPVVVRLLPSNGVELVVTAAEPWHLAWLRVQLTLGEGHAVFPARYAALGGPQPERVEELADGHTLAEYMLPHTGSIAFCDLPVGQPFVVALLDRYDAVLWSQRCTLGPDQRWVGAYRLGAAPRNVRGQVRSTDDGVPLDARVRAGRREVGVDRHGWFTLHDVHGPSPACTVTASGFAPRQLAAGALDEDPVLVLRR